MHWSRIPVWVFSYSCIHRRFYEMLAIDEHLLTLDGSRSQHVTVKSLSRWKDGNFQILWARYIYTALNLCLMPDNRITEERTERNWGRRQNEERSELCQLLRSASKKQKIGEHNAQDNYSPLLGFVETTLTFQFGKSTPKKLIVFVHIIIIFFTSSLFLLCAFFLFT